jgi:hypothetical protein
MNSVIVTIGGLVVSLIGAIIFEVYKPDIKKHASLIKKLLRLIILYALPLSIIFYLMFNKAIQIDKWFVFGITANLFFILFVAVFDTIRKARSTWATNSAVDNLDKKLDKRIEVLETQLILDHLKRMNKEIEDSIKK